MQEAAAIDDFIDALDATRKNAQEAGRGENVQVEQKAPADSRGGKKYSIDPAFDREIRQWDKDGRNESRVFTLGTTSETLKSIGVKDKSIVMVSDKIRRIMREHPSMTLDMIRQIPQMLEHPTLVLESKGGSMIGKTTQNSRIVVIGNVTDANGYPVLSVLDLAPSTRGDIKLGLQDFNKVSSAYAKTVNPKGFLRESNVLYVTPNTKKADATFNSFGFKFASSELNHIGSIGSIAYEGGKVNISGVPFSEVVGQAQKKTAQNLGAAKALTADGQSSSATVNNSEAGNNSFGFQFATSELNRIGSIEAPAEMQSAKKTLLATDVGRKASTADSVQQNDKNVKFSYGEAETAQQKNVRIEQNREQETSYSYNGNEDSLNKTGIDDDPVGHTETEQKRIKAYKDAADPNLMEFIHDVRQHPEARWMNYPLGKVNSETAEKVRTLTGVDVHGYTHSMQNSTVQHIDKRHGINGIADHSMAVDADIARIGWVLENYDSIESGTPSKQFKNKDGSRAATILYKKTIDGTMYVVEAVPDSKAHKMQVVTAYIANKKAGAYHQPDAINRPKATAKTDGEITTAITDNILQDSENVKYSKKSAAEQVVNEATEKEQLKKQLAETEAEKKELARKYTKAAESAEYWRQETQLSIRPMFAQYVSFIFLHVFIACLFTSR